MGQGNPCVPVQPADGFDQIMGHVADVEHMSRGREGDIPNFGLESLAIIAYFQAEIRDVPLASFATDLVVTGH